MEWKDLDKRPSQCPVYYQGSCMAFACILKTGVPSVAYGLRSGLQLLRSLLRHDRSLAWCRGLNDQALLQLWLGFNPWPGNLHVLWVWPLEQNKNRGKQTSRLTESRKVSARSWESGHGGGGSFWGFRFQLGKRNRFWKWWWCWLHDSVSVFNATEPDA